MLKDIAIYAVGALLILGTASAYVLNKQNQAVQAERIKPSGSSRLPNQTRTLPIGERSMPHLTRTTLLLSAVATGLIGCSQTGAAIVNDGSGFSMNSLNRPALAAVINLDLPAAKRIIANDETCMKQPACRKDR